ncbi:MAG: hypothetical protein AB7R77_11380, partial [Ilumatobacteraceae bacterium]
MNTMRAARSRKRLVAITVALAAGVLSVGEPVPIVRADDAGPVVGTITIVKDSSRDDGLDFAFSGPDPIGSFSLDDDVDAALSNSATFVVGTGNWTINEAA